MIRATGPASMRWLITIVAVLAIGWLVATRWPGVIPDWLGGEPDRTARPHDDDTDAARRARAAPTGSGDARDVVAGADDAAMLASGASARATYEADPALRDAFERGRAYGVARDAWVDRMRVLRYGQAIADLLALPVDEAWAALEQRIAEGDRLAADALAELATECSAEPPHARFARMSRYVADELQLSSTELAFQNGALVHEVQTIDARRQACVAKGLGVSRLRTLLGDDASDDVTDDALATAFRERFGASDVDFADPVAQAGEDAIEALATDATLDADRRAALLAAIDQSAPAIEGYARCLIHGCYGQSPSTEAEREAWIHRAATMGSSYALNDLVDFYSRRGDTTEAYAWARYNEFLEARACTAFPTVIELSRSRSVANRIGDALTPLERSIAEQRADAVIRESGPVARAVQRCPE